MTQTWEYKVEPITMADRWSKKQQAEELSNLHLKINSLGAQGWELISYESIPMYGTFSSSLKGYAYLIFFKRPLEN